MRRMISLLACCLILSGGWAAAQTGDKAPAAEAKRPEPAEHLEPSEPPAPPEQPIPFNHKLHVGLGLQCLDCHPIKDPGYAAGYPQEAKCMACHASIKTDSPAIQKLAEYEKAGEPVPWVKIYRVPDYVWFSHEWHHGEAKIECSSCHGPVAERDALFKEKPTSMTACMGCHQQSKAPNDCDVCHDPG